MRVSRGLKLVSALAIVLACAVSLAAQEPDAAPPEKPAADDVTFSEREVREGLWYVTLRSGPKVGALGGSFASIAHASRLTVDAGKTYYTMRPHGRSVGDQFSYEIEMWEQPPEGAHVIDPRDSATYEGSESAEFVVDNAEGWLSLSSGEAAEGSDAASSSEELRATRTVHVDTLGLTRRRFAPDTEVGGVRSMALNTQDVAWPAPVFVSEVLRVSWFEVDGTLVEQVELPEREPKIPGFARGPSPLMPFTPRAGEVAFLATGGGWTPVAALSAQGELLWQYDEMPYEGRRAAPDSIAAGDLDGDGEAEFVVATGGSSGLYFLDERGRVEHRVTGRNAGTVAILDLDDDAKLELLYIGHAGYGALDANGDPLNAHARPSTDERPTKWGPKFNLVPGRDGSPLIAQLYDRELHLTRPDGTQHEQFDLPGVATLSDVQLAWLRRSADAAPLLAVSCRGEVRDHLFVLDSAGAVLHHELLAAEAFDGPPLVAIPQPDGRDALLVGAHDGLWLYEFP